MKVIFSITLALFIFSTNAQSPTNLTSHSKKDLINDFEILIGAIKEAHPGLYWYTTPIEFDNLCAIQKNKIFNEMNTLQFYNLITPIISSVREGHFKVNGTPNDINNYLRNSIIYLPIIVKSINGELFIVNDIGSHSTQGKIIKTINGEMISVILEKMFKQIPSDGYIQSFKYEEIRNAGFSNYYAEIYTNTGMVDIGLMDPETNKSEVIRTKKVSKNKLYDYHKRYAPTPKEEKYQPIKLESIDTNTMLLTLNTFDDLEYKDESFTYLLDNFFNIIHQKKPSNLILDLRNNGGGEEFYSTVTFSYFAEHLYKQFHYVEANTDKFSFLEYTNYRDNPEKIKNDIVEQHRTFMDGRLLRREGVLVPAKPKDEIFQGAVYVLIGGKTYSAATLFASLMKNHIEAIFIGKETGGGYYGNTGGFTIYLSLPNSGINIKIPLLKFVNNVEEKMPFGRGIIPDYEIEPTFEEYINGIDTELEFTLKLIKKHSKIKNK